MFLGNASPTTQITPRVERLPSPARLATIMAAPPPPGLFPGLIPRSFTTKVAKHGLFRDSTIAAGTAALRRGPLGEKARKRRLDEVSRRFDEDLRRVRVLERQLGASQNRLSRAMSRRAGSVLIQTRVRTFLAQCLRLRLHEIFCARFVCDRVRYRWRRLAVHSAVRAIVGWYRTLKVLRLCTLKRRHLGAAMLLQPIVRSTQARAHVALLRTLKKVARKTVHTFVTFGFARAVLSLQTPFRAASQIQRAYRVHLRQRRLAERRHNKRAFRGRAVFAFERRAPNARTPQQTSVAAARKASEASAASAGAGGTAARVHMAPTHEEKSPAGAASPPPERREDSSRAHKGLLATFDEAALGEKMDSSRPASSASGGSVFLTQPSATSPSSFATDEDSAKHPPANARALPYAVAQRPSAPQPRHASSTNARRRLPKNNAAI